MMFLYQNLKEDVVPLWNRLWYAGSSFLVLYGPLSYCIAMPLAFLIGPLNAYIFNEIFFLLASSVSVYCLSKSITENEQSSFMASILFLISSFTIFNFSVVDRYANIVEIFFFINSLHFLLRLYVSQIKRNAVILGVFIALTFLSQGFGFMLLLILIAFTILKKRSWEYFKHITLSLLISFLIVVPWLLVSIPNFIYSILNPFENVWRYRKYIDFPRIAGTALFMGMPVLVVLLFRFEFFRKIKKIVFVLVLLLLIAGLVFFQSKYNISKEIFVLNLGITGFIVLHDKIKFDSKIEKLYWITILLVILSLALPLYSFTPLGILDPQRIPVHATIPIAIVVSYSLRKNKLSLLLIAIAFTTISLSLLTTNFCSSIRIDEKIIQTLKAGEDGRFIAPEAPVWTEMLPLFTGKPSIDGHSPYERFLPELRKYKHQNFGSWFEGVTIEERNTIYKHLIENSEKYAIKYVLVVNGSAFIMPNVSYATIYSSPEFIIMKLENNVSFIEGGVYKWLDANTVLIHPTKDRVLLREAYAPGWKTSCGNLKSDEDGFMLIEGNCKEIILRYAPSIFDIPNVKRVTV
jgi:hypothetical protein